MKASIYLTLKIAATVILSFPVMANEFEFSSSILDVESQEISGSVREKGKISEFFKAQKEVVFTALRDLGVDIAALPPSTREKLVSFHTTNFEAFSLFSKGLQAQDEKKYAEAKRLFEQAANLDPSFELAKEKSADMPSVNITGDVGFDAVMANISTSAVSDAQASVETDIAGALDALSAGLNVVVGQKLVSSAEAASSDNLSGATDFTSNEPGTASDFAEQSVLGFVFTRQNVVDVSIGGTTVVQPTQLIFESPNSPISIELADGLTAERNQATNQTVGSFTLRDGSETYWGNWLSSDSAQFDIVTDTGAFPDLGPEFQYMIGSSTTQLPTTGQVTFSPQGGFLQNTSGSISVDFSNREVLLNNLGFDLNGRSYSDLVGQTVYNSNAGAAGFFSGNYTSGSCAGCTSFEADRGSFTGNFVGQDADGIVFSTILDNGAGTDAGLHLFSNE